MPVIIYTKPGCPYCAAAKQDLEARSADYVEIDVYTSPGAREQLAEAHRRHERRARDHRGERRRTHLSGGG